MLQQGKTSSLEAEVWYFPDGTDQVESPYLEGPFNRKAQTLKARYPFQPADFQGERAWKVIIPEPCLWSAQSPALYALNGQKPLIGLRDLRVRAESFYQEDRRWVIRAARGNYSNNQNLLASGLIPIHRQGDLAYFDVSTAMGHPVILWPDGYPRLEIERLSRCAALLMLVLPANSAQEITAKAHSHLLLGAELHEGDSLPDWAKFAVVSEDLVHQSWQPSRRLPVVVTRQCVIDGLPASEVRTQCDLFQASLDRGAEFAGLWLMDE